MKKMGIVFCLMFAFMLNGCGAVEDVVVKVDAPLKVANDEEFIITATVKNNASKEQTLVSLDIGDDYLEGIAIVETDPDHSESTHIPIDNTVSYVFDAPIKSGEEIKIDLYARALKKGDFNSEIDFCINSDFNFTSKSIRTVVE